MFFAKKVIGFEIGMMVSSSISSSAKPVIIVRL